jgi:hypothetical protein
MSYYKVLRTNVILNAAENGEKLKTWASAWCSNPENSSIEERLFNSVASVGKVRFRLDQRREGIYEVILCGSAEDLDTLLPEARYEFVMLAILQAFTSLSRNCSATGLPSWLREVATVATVIREKHGRIPVYSCIAARESREFDLDEVEDWLNQALAAEGDNLDFPWFLT